MTKVPFTDHTMDSKETMRLHINNADLHVRAVLQLSVGVKNVTGTAATIAVVPPDALLPSILRS